ncbi:RHS repeat-associated core domain-containing protein [Actinokineospora diospyrosa]|uniref:RHS repeat-associated core domain-containing protein n=1 Tax=Actinokineospora diospyrosa TaxID=103728 RepID=UPI0020A34CDB|nr:RHS repeat-associated core domain-containing protein [Actinokineospora diospyrosa]
MTTTIAVDALGRTVSETQPLTASTSATTGFGYDAAGNQTRLTDANNNKTISGYNAWNLLESVLEPTTPQHSAVSNRTWTTTYDALHRPTKIAQPGGVVRNRVYDVLGNLTNETGTGTAVSTDARELGYDLEGRITSAKAGTGNNTYTYDDRGNLLTMAGPSGTASHTYDDNGRLSSRTDAAGTSSFTYTPTGNLLTAADPRTGTTATYGYDNAGRMTSVGYGTGNGSRAYTWDDLDRMLTDKVKNAAGADTASISYGYDDADRLTSKTTSGTAGAASNTYAHDLAGRLTSWTSGSTTTAYTWDKNGNRLTAGSTSYTYNQRNRLVTAGSTAYDFTARGTLEGTTTGGVTTQYRADAFDRLVVDGTRNYGYDSLDRRIGTGVSYSSMGNDLAADGTATYSRLPSGDLLGLTQGAASGLAFTDRHTDLVGTYTAAGAISDSAAYDPFGSVQARTGPAHPLGYQSEWTDDVTGRVNMAARWYNPGTGTFYARDDITGPSGPGAVGHNRYTYGNASPMNYTDPSGHLGHCAGPVALTAPAPPVAAAVGAICTTATILVLVSRIEKSNLVRSLGPMPQPKPILPNQHGGPDSLSDVPGCRTVGCGSKKQNSNPVSVVPAGAGGGAPPNRPPKSRVSTAAPGGGGGGSNGAAAAATRAAQAARVLLKALTPVVKPPSGPTLAPSVLTLIADAGTIVASVVSGQTALQGALPGSTDEPQPGPGAGGGGSTGTTGGTDENRGRCTHNWQVYGPRQPIVHNGLDDNRSTMAVACVVSVNTDDRVDRRLELPGLDTSGTSRMARCHLIAHKLNGSNTDIANFVPCGQDLTNNSWGYWKFEYKVVKQVRDHNNPVHMTVVPVYADANNPVPTAIVATAVGNDNKWVCTVSIPNVNKAKAAAHGITFKGWLIWSVRSVGPARRTTCRTGRSRSGCSGSRCPTTTSSCSPSCLREIMRVQCCWRRLR